MDHPQRPVNTDVQFVCTFYNIILHYWSFISVIVLSSGVPLRTRQPGFTRLVWWRLLLTCIPKALSTET